MSKRALGFLAATLATAASASGAVSFNFTFTDSGTGFNDPVAGAERRAALSLAADRLEQYLPSHTATIEITVSSFSANNSLLGSGGSSTPLFSANNFRPTFVQNKILSGTDLNGATADGSLQFNFFHSWGYGDSVSGAQYDFQSVAMHELLHAMGFSSWISDTGQGAKNNAAGTPDTWATFDQFLATFDGTKLITTDFRYHDASVTGLAPLTGNPGVYWVGANAVAAFGGPVPMFSPSTFSDGSSLSHVNGLSTAGQGWLMNPSVSAGLASRELTAVEIGMLQDMGYAAVPELERLGWMAGLGLVAVGMGRRWRSKI